jgi:hypothetical protein
MNIKLIRMWSGEDVVSEVTEETDDFLTLVNPIVAVPAGNGQLGFAPWSPLLKSRGTPLSVRKDYVVYVTETQPDVESQYQEMFSVIATPPKSNLIL